MKANNKGFAMRTGIARVYRTILLALLFAAVFSPAFISLGRAWVRNSEFSHGFLVPLVSLFVIWQKRERLKSITLQTYSSGIWVLGFGLIFYVLGILGDVQVVFQLSLIISLTGLLLHFGGKAMTKELLFPLGFLVFMIPIPGSLQKAALLPMKLFATKASVEIIQALGIPALREGNVIHLSRSTLFVADACSGLRSIMALLPLGVFLSYLTKKSMLERAVLVIAAIPIALTGNILRIVGTVMLSQYVSQKAAEGYLHEFSGLSVFMFGLLCLIIVGRALDWIPMKRSTGSS